MFDAHAGVGGAELLVDALWGRITGLCPRDNLRGDRGLRRPARGQGLPRQDAQIRFGPVEPVAVPGRKHPLYAPGQAARLGGRKGPVKRGVGMGVQIVADPDQALGLAVAWMIREGLHLARSVHVRAPRAQRLHKHPEGAGAASTYS